MNTSEQRKPWEHYESVVTHLLNRFATEFGLDRVEEKQKIKGKTTTWQIDAKGVRESDRATILVECRRKRRKLNQRALGATAFSIQDIGAKGGIVVTPLELQSGAARIAHAKKIIAVQLDARSTPTDFAMRFLSKLMVGASLDAHATARSDLRCQVIGETTVQANAAAAGDSTVAMAARLCSSCGKQFPLVDYEQRHCPQCKRIGEV